MSGPVGDWTPEQLREALGAPPGMTPARPATITVERLDRTGPDGEGVRAEVAIGYRNGDERWRLTFDSMWADVCDFPLVDAAFMVWTNIVEWWDTRPAESPPPWLTAERIG